MKTINKKFRIAKYVFVTYACLFLFACTNNNNNNNSNAETEEIYIAYYELNNEVIENEIIYYNDSIAKDRLINLSI